MRKAKLPARIKTIEDLLSLDDWHYLSRGLAAQEPRAAYAIVLVRCKDGDLVIAGTMTPDAEAVLMLEEAKRKILDWRVDDNA